MVSNAPKAGCSIDLSAGGNHGAEIAGDFPALIAVEM